MKKQIFLGLLAFLVISFLVVKANYLNKGEEILNQEVVKTEQLDDELRIISTVPDPLDEATILPTQAIEIKFNKQISASEFKHTFDPEIEHEVEAIYEKDSGTRIIIKFKKPLELGHGYTLFVLQNTNSHDKKTLDREYIYHLKTIKYKGV